MESPVFEYQDYKKYLLHLASHRPRGFKKSLAEACGCQTGYITHVLKGSAHLSLEQAESISRKIGHGPEETECFLSLVEFTRAGTASLRRIFEQRLDRCREGYLRIKSRIEIQETLTPALQAEYYSAWYYAAIHVMLTIPAFRTRESVARALSMDGAVVAGVLDYLMRVGLATRTGSRYAAGSAKIHLEKDSVMIPRHHSHWRLQALRSIERNRPGDLHFSSVFTLNQRDAEQIRALAVQLIESSVRIIQASPEEKTCVMGLDFFDLI